MRRRSAHLLILPALTVLILGAAPWVVGAATTTEVSPFPGTAQAAARPAAPTLQAVVDSTPMGAPLPTGFLGLSFEYSALDAYTGGNPAALNPVFIRLLRNLAPAGQPLVLRIGGDSTDATWWRVRGLPRPAGVKYALTPRWIAAARALAIVLPARLILGINLATSRRSLAAAEARALLGGIGSRNVAALELGNEPDVYGVFPWYTGTHGVVFARDAAYSLSAYVHEVKRWTAALPKVAVAGPATAKLPWLAGLSGLVRAAPRLRIVTVHRYALEGCQTDADSPAYPSIANLLSDRSSAALAEALEPFVTAAHARGLEFRVDELNSAALAGCLGRAGVSDTFASALWMVDALFDLASVGVDGVNVHSLPGAAYAPFTFERTPAGWMGSVRPDYYGMLMFAQAFPPGARLLPVHVAGGQVKVWATWAPDGRTQVVLINKAPRARDVALALPESGAARIEWLRGPSAAATSGVTLGGVAVGATGVLTTPHLESISPRLGRYWIDMPGASAALVTG